MPNAMNKFNFGKNLRKVRLSKSISQDAMAYHIGISQKSYSRMENQSDVPVKERVDKTAIVLGVEPAELLPPITEPDVNYTYESGMGQKAKEILETRFGKLLIAAIGCALIPSVYSLTKSFCNQFGAPVYVTVIAAVVAGSATLAYIWYVVVKIKKAK